MLRRAIRAPKVALQLAARGLSTDAASQAERLSKLGQELKWADSQNPTSEELMRRPIVRMPRGRILPPPVDPAKLPVNPRTNRPWSSFTVRRRNRAPDESRISSEQFAATRKPYGVPVKVRQPISERLASGPYLLRQLRHEEKDRVLKLFPREACEFKTGDRIAVHKAISLYNPKTQIYRGLVIDKRRGPHASFTLRCVKEETMFEIQLPLYSPFIRKIEMQSPGTSRRNKIYETREMDEEQIKKVNANPQNEQ